MRRVTNLLALSGVAIALLAALPGVAAAAPAAGGSVRLAPMPAATHVPGHTAAPAASTPGVQPNSAFGCPDGYSCYYDGHNGTGMIWVPLSCGFYNLFEFSPPLNDQISSIVNLGGGAIQPYNWDGVGSWVPVGPAVPVGFIADYYGGFDNVIDAVSINC
ncbi:MAG TPA: peptidase inhibitor family I36 protein [Mycobacteriales bacterium]|nr:peptidase inhibitor family I36 protein [Mycobacteriales bacterium]